MFSAAYSNVPPGHSPAPYAKSDRRETLISVSEDHPKRGFFDEKWLTFPQKEVLLTRNGLTGAAAKK